MLDKPRTPKRPNKWIELVRSLGSVLRWFWWKPWCDWNRIRNTTSPNCICPVDYYLAVCPEHGETVEFYGHLKKGVSDAG